MTASPRIPHRQFETSLGLLDRLRQESTREAAWQDFFVRYGHLLYQWCQRWGLQPSDAEDVAQETLLILVRQLDQFAYDPGQSFRSWLKTIAWRAWIHAQRTPAARPIVGSPSLVEALASLAARDDLLDRSEQLARQELLEQACEQVQLRVAPRTWQAFQCTVLEQQPMPVVAQRLGMSVANVYRIRSRLTLMLGTILQELEPH